MSMVRTVEPETLDHLSPTDSRAQRSRRDLQRIHRAMGSCSILLQGWRSVVNSRDQSAFPDSPLRVLELGAGDGTLLLRVARALGTSCGPVALTLLDRQAIITDATRRAYADLDWDTQVLTADVIDWAKPAPADASRWDLIVTSLFLHHFKTADLTLLLAGIASRSRAFLACEPHRGSLALASSHLVGAIGANAVTREDAVLSVHAGFREREITALWPSADTTWTTQERRAGLFSQCFLARRQTRDHG